MKAIHCLMLFSALMLIGSDARSAHGQDHAPKTKVWVAPNATVAAPSKPAAHSVLARKTSLAERDFWRTEVAWMPTCSALVLMLTAQMASILQLKRNRRKNYLISS
jgi:hypothetical protein